MAEVLTFHNSENAVINFAEGGYTYIGRTTINLDSQETLSELIENRYLKILRNWLPSKKVATYEPLYIVDTKLTLKLFNSPRAWTAGELTRMMTILRHYLLQHDSKQKLELSVASTTGLRANLKIEEVSCVYIQTQYEAPGLGLDDTMNVYFYTDEAISAALGSRALDTAVDWAYTRSSRGAEMPRGLEQIFAFRTTTLDIFSYPVGADYASIKFDALVIGLSALKELFKDELEGHWCVFIAAFRKRDDRIQSRVRYLIGSERSDAPFAPTVDEQTSMNVTTVNQTLITAV